jgi:hypothetical protein
VHRQSLAQRLRAAFVLSTALLLAACGSGGTASSDAPPTGAAQAPAGAPSPAPTPPVPPPAPPAPPPAPPVPPPTIAGQPAPEVMVGQPYAFTPTATSPSGARLAFAIVGQPRWATFDPASGRLAGTPTAADVGRYDVRISAGDGTQTAVLAFAVTVTPAPAGRATLSWAAPTTRTDGTPLTNLAGFRIYYGTSANALGQRLEIRNPSISTAVVENLTPGTWYFAASAVDADGQESYLSGTASKTIG